MIQVNIIHARQQASQVLRTGKEKSETENATIHAGILNYLSWAYTTEDIYYPTHRNGAFDLYLYELSQSHLTGDRVEGVTLKEGDMLVIQAGTSEYPVVKRVGEGFTAFEFWFSESGFLTGTEKPDVMKFTASQFPRQIENDVLVRRLFGEEAPVVHINGLLITELLLPPSSTFVYNLKKGRKLGIFVIQGEGETEHNRYIAGDFIELFQLSKDQYPVNIISGAEGSSHLIVMDLDPDFKDS